jgi:rhodanese-related sulfurtransferase
MKKSDSTPIIIDVRRKEEFEKGHAENSINIPLQEMDERMDELAQINQPLIVVCGGGTRHVKAYELLKGHGINVEKGGSWKDVKNK